MTVRATWAACAIGVDVDAEQASAIPEEVFVGAGRSISLLVAGLLAAGSLAACSSSSNESNGPVTLTMVEYQKIRSDAIAKVLPDFEAAMKEKGKQVKVKLIREELPDDQFKTKITQQYNAGEAPDVADYGSPNVPGFAGAGYLLDLTPYLEDWADWSSFYPDVRDQVVQPDGKVYALPHEANTQTLFFRKDVLTKLSVSTEQPATWTDLISRLQQVTQKTGEPSIVLPAGTAWGAGSFGEGFLNVMLGTDSPLYNTDTDKWVVESPGLTETFGIYEQLAKNELLPTEALLNPEPWQPTKYEAFPAGRLPVAAQGTWGWRYDWGPTGATPIPGLTKKVSTWEYPSAHGEPYAVSGVGFSYAVSAKTEHPDEAVELAKWLSRGKPMAEQLTAVGAVAPRSGIDRIAPYSREKPLIDAGKTLATARSFPTRPGQDQIAQAIAEATEGILTGTMDGPTAAKAFADSATELLGPDKVETSGT
jgi:multiple sugar transport system substrate-binding protein